MRHYLEKIRQLLDSEFLIFGPLTPDGAHMREPFGDKGDLDKWKAFHVEIAELHVEIERLRAFNTELVATLQNIAEHSDFCSDWPHDIENMQERARAAVAKAKGLA